MFYVIEVNFEDSHLEDGYEDYVVIQNAPLTIGVRVYIDKNSNPPSQMTYRYTPHGEYDTLKEAKSYIKNTFICEEKERGIHVLNEDSVVWYGKLL
jgi:hypothetical protein